VIDIEGFKAMRDQLFAEAVARRRDGEQWWPTREIEEEYFEAEQGARYEADVWEPIVLAKLAEGTPMTVAEAAINVKEVGQFTKGDQNRVTAIMERAGWERRHIRGHNGAKLWIPPGTPNPKSTKHGSRRKTHQGR
jgi:putative DNA primase/helicase